MSALNIEKKDAWTLWTRACSRCSFYGCYVYLVKEEKEGIPGNMAHIVAREHRGPRGHSELTPEERNSYPNLLLHCPNHHTLIDVNEAEWTVEKLLKMKQDHEEWVKVQLLKGKDSRVQIAPGLMHYVNLRRLAFDPSASAYFSLWDSNFDFDAIKSFSELGLVKSAQIRSFVQEFLRDWNPSTLALGDLSKENVGARIKFETEFRTKNVPGPDKLGSFKLTGNIQRDPHIYCEIGARKIYFTIDPRWITADTAFILFKSGRVQFSGLGILNCVTSTEAYATPLIIGSPDYPGSDSWTSGSTLIHF